MRNRLAYLRAACRWAWRHHAMGEHDPAARMVMPAVSNARHVYMTPAEVAALARQCGAEMGAIVRLTFYCGLRWVSELLPRTPDDVIRVGRITFLRVGMTKNGSPRMVPVHPSAVKDLRRLPFTRHWRTYYAEFETARVAIGRPEVTMHDLRHSLASAIISAGGTLSDVQGALHHESMQSSARYAHLYPERLREVLFKVAGPAQKRRKFAHNGGGAKPKKAA